LPQISETRWILLLFGGAEETLKVKRDLRLTTRRGIRYFTRVLIRRCPELKRFPDRKLTPEHGTHFLEAAFASHRQDYKGRTVMRIWWRGSFRKVPDQ
ncbi:hypothetical protein, partial [uncultured Akkermansia sp.]|uniref:hypothetical protein n=1 Tax=uncultured Akkermansia sp. TaxID=512294 RepID=UPI002605D5A9